MVVMFTLKRHGNKLLGPINRKLYASFAVKKHAFAIARREANKRGFGPGAGKLIQIVTDGDPDFATYATEYFPEAMHSLDVMHVIEKLWTAGECLFREAPTHCVSGSMRRRIDDTAARSTRSSPSYANAVTPSLLQAPAIRANANACSG